MKKFILNLLLISSIFLLIDRCFIIFRYNETNIFSDIAKEKMEKIRPLFHSKRKFNIVVMGSSHAQFGVSPGIITKETGLSCLNIAYGAGANIGKQLNLLKEIVASNNIKTPDYILLGIDVFTLNEVPVYGDIYQNLLLNNTNNKYSISRSKFLRSYISLYAHFIPRYLDDCFKKKYITPPLF